MPRTTITPQVVGWQMVTTGPGEAAIVWTKADAANKHRFLSTGREVLLARNTGATSHTVTVNAPATPFGRLGSLTAYAIPAGSVARLGRFSSDWVQPDGYVYLEASDEDIEFALLRLS